MLFHILSSETLVTKQSAFETTLVFVLLGVAFTAFIFLRVTDYLDNSK
jgi:hypothetical protein